MKLVIISDTHGYLRERDIPDGDVLIHCGDACSSGQIFEFERFVGQMHSISTKFKMTLYTPGNHDRCVEAMPEVCREMFDGVDMMKMLIHEPFEFEGVKFFGSPYTPQFCNWSFMYPRENAAWRWADIPDDTDVLFVHGMPYYIFDGIGTLIGKTEMERVGCPYLRNRVFEIQPKVFAGGHLHLEGGQQREINGTIFANAAICDDSYQPVHKPIEIEI